MDRNRRLERIRVVLLQWYEANARDLPWRRTTDPYAIWVSEVMLQQTRVETVAPYYERFLRRFPTVERLARARADSVLKVWEGMGYYGRARNMHRAAKDIVCNHDGQFPQHIDCLMKLPGIGRYTGGAIASIAFGRDEPVVDGNVARVLCRLFRIEQAPQTQAAHKQLWQLARDLLPPGRAGAFNQALMELGAIVCKPTGPQCRPCPLARFCLAKRAGRQSALPKRRKPKPLPRYTVVVAIIYRGGKILIDKRKPDGLLGGLWEFPGGKKKRSETLKQALHREVREELGIRIDVDRRLTIVRHAYSHFAVTLHAFLCELTAGRPRCRSCTDCRWVRPDELANYAFPAANRKIIAALQAATT